MEAPAQPKPNFYSSDRTSCWGRNTNVSRVFKWSTPQCLRCQFFNFDQDKELSVGFKHNWGTSRSKSKRRQFQKKHQVWKFVTVEKALGAQTGGVMQRPQSHPAEPGWAVSQSSAGSRQGGDVTGAACQARCACGGSFGRGQKTGALSPPSKPESRSTLPSQQAREEGMCSVLVAHLLLVVTGVFRG